MLRFLTQKLRTQSLNEVDRPFHQHDDLHKKQQQHHDNGQEEEAALDLDVDESEDDRDSGTESDDENTEFDEADELQAAAIIVEGTDCTRQRRERHELRRSARLEATTKGGGNSGTEARRRRHAARRDDQNESEDDDNDEGHDGVRSMSPKKKKLAPSPVLAPLLDADSALPSDSDHFDHHSSEEELDVINSGGTMSTEDDGPVPAPTWTSSLDRDSGPRRWIRDGGTRRLGSRPPIRCSSPSSPPLMAVRQHHQMLRARSKSSNSLQPITTLASTRQNIGNNRDGFSSSSATISCHLPEKRKWSQANVGVGDRNENAVTAAAAAAAAAAADSSSDDEVRHLMRSLDTPVEFRTSPPAELIAAVAASAASSTPSSVKVVRASSTSTTDDHHHQRGLPRATKLFHFSSSNFTPFEVCSVSPRKRHRQMIVKPDPPSSSSLPSSADVAADAVTDRVLQRPCLDFEKMQQMRNRSKRTTTANQESSRVRRCEPD